LSQKHQKKAGQNSVEKLVLEKIVSVVETILGYRHPRRRNHYEPKDNEGEDGDGENLIGLIIFHFHKNVKAKSEKLKTTA